MVRELQRLGVVEPVADGRVVLRGNDTVSRDASTLMWSWRRHRGDTASRRRHRGDLEVRKRSETDAASRTSGSSSMAIGSSGSTSSTLSP